MFPLAVKGSKTLNQSCVSLGAFMANTVLFTTNAANTPVDTELEETG